MAKSQPDITGLRDLTQEQRDDIDALCEEGLLPSTIGRRLGIPTSVAAAARLAWKRQQEIEQPTPIMQPVQQSNDPMMQLNAMMQQQLSAALLQTQLETMQEQARHRKVANKLEEQERAMELRERIAQFREDYPVQEQATESIPLDFDFENNPVGATLSFIDRLKTAPNRSPDANTAPQSNDNPDPRQPLTEEQISAYMAKQPREILGKAIAAVDSPYQNELIAVLKKNAAGITDENIDKVLQWLRKQKKPSRK